MSEMNGLRTGISPHGDQDECAACLIAFDAEQSD